MEKTEEGVLVTDEELIALKKEKEELFFQSLGVRLKFYRERAKLTMLEVAKRFGISERIVASYEKGYSKPAVEYLVLGAAIFEVKEEELGHYLFGKNMPFETACKIIAPKANSLIGDGKRTIKC